MPGLRPGGTGSIPVGGIRKMVFGVAIDKTGRPICPCCRDWLWHCKKCWDRYHNGKEHKDYEPPKYYGQSMLAGLYNGDIEHKYNITFNPTIKEDENRKYKEGEYH